MFLEINTLYRIIYSVYCFWFQTFPSLLFIRKINAACTVNMTQSAIDFCHLIFHLQLYGERTDGEALRVFHVSAHLDSL